MTGEMRCKSRFRIIEADPSAWSFAKQLYCEATKITHPEFDEQAVREHVNARRSRWFASGAYALLAVDFDGPIGIVWVLSGWQDPAGDYIQLIAVAPDRRREGVGTQLLMSAVARSRERGQNSLRLGYTLTIHLAWLSSESSASSLWVRLAHCGCSIFP